MNAPRQLPHCGYVAIIGRPNAGKSTLLNRLLGQKISITSRKPQTTRHRILGVKTDADAQVIYVDTPGLHEAGKHAMNRLMNRAALTALQDVDVVLFVVDELHWSEEERYILGKLQGLKTPVMLVINKVDKLAGRERLLPHIERLSALHDFTAIIPVSARDGTNVEAVEAQVRDLLPSAPQLFPEDQVTDRSERFIAAELIREKLMRRLGQEVPYALTVEIEEYTMKKGVLHVGALIWVERTAQKAIVIGKSGGFLKETGKQARRDMEQMLGHKVFLRLWVKVKKKWSDDERALRHLGYGE